MCFFLSESSKTSPTKTPKKIKVEVYKLTKAQKALIKNDEANKKLWDEAMESLSLGPVRMAVYLVKSPAGFLNAYAYVWWETVDLFVVPSAFRTKW